MTLSDTDEGQIRTNTTFTGGAQGVGAAAVGLYHGFGAHVYFGDWDDAKGTEVEKQYQSTTTGGSVHYRKLNVKDYDSQLALFDDAFKAHGHVDVAISCAAVKESGGWFEPQDLNLETVKKVSPGS